ncbi:MAG TPA: chromosome segregation protein SMC [bacterium]|nr:chromosome segregation protein SMC [bacterium]
MYLKKIEFQGFKSFVDPTVLSFEPGISAIIGPNGCGKSNVSDAIRWVLGEQSAKALRGSKMADVIFNGTDTRKPGGMAEVSLTISNEDRALAMDFAEVCVTRRSYRSGESEYLINKAPARLKDIYALFTDTGIGTDGYSLLEQGKLDLILSSKPMERRSVFEEAAGITKYKAQRDEALRKLEATDQNLLRVNDIVNEVKRQIGSLERQARRAEKYQTLKSELDKLRAVLLVGEVKASRETRLAMDAALLRLRDALDVLEAKQKEQDASTAGLRLELSGDDEALAKANQALYALESQAAQLDRQQELNRAQISNLEERAQRALADAGDQRAKEARLKAEWTASQAQQAAEEEALRGLKQKLEESESALRESSARRQQRSEQAQVLQQRLIQCMDQKSAAKGESEALQGRLSMLDTRSKQLETELGQAQTSLQEAGRRLEEAAAQAGVKDEEVRSLEDVLGGQYLRKLELDDALRAADESVNAAQVVLGSERARLGALEELSRALEGYEAGPKALLQARAKDGGPAPVESLAHRVRAKAEAEAAVELALGKRLQTLLVDDEAEAFAALEWLKTGKHGRASMLSKSIFRANPAGFDAAVLSLDGVMGPLTQFMEADAGLQDILGWLAGGYLLVRDLDSARAAARLLGPGAEAVTLDGWLVSAEGLISGGASDAAERGLLSRDREMAALNANIAQGDARLETLRQGREHLRNELSELSRSIEQQSRQKSDAEIAVARLQKEQGARQEDVGRLAGESEEKRKAIEAVQVEAAGFRGRHENLSRQVAELAAQEAALQGELNAVLDAINQLRSDEERCVQQVNEQRVAQAGAEQRLQNHRVSSGRLEQETRVAGEQAGRREGEAASARTEQEALRGRNEGLEADLKALFEKRETAQEQVRLLTERRQERMDAIAFGEEALRLLRHEAQSVAAERHEQELRAQELRLKLDALEKTLVTDFHFDLQALDQAQLFAQVDGEESAPQDVSPERVEELTRKIEDLGVVNPAAAEEYRELEQRHSLLVGQLEDLRSAKADLMKVIHKINQESRERFLATFEKVHEAFKRTFKTLFGGGEAHLLLMEEGDLLEAGIDIIARPPGKRQQSITLLSGGEKALTATALLFALFETKPSPFCVLDEIDAPLDDANIMRFSDLLTQYAKNTQFIVITHSKLTMEKADVLYGVTMEEAGVSRVISAKFRGEKAVTVA